jgi:hypothetical protein
MEVRWCIFIHALFIDPELIIETNTFTLLREDQRKLRQNHKNIRDGLGQMRETLSRLEEALQTRPGL